MTIIYSGIIKAKNTKLDFLNANLLYVILKEKTNSTRHPLNEHSTITLLQLLTRIAVIFRFKILQFFFVMFIIVSFSILTVTL